MCSLLKKNNVVFVVVAFLKVYLGDIGDSKVGLAHSEATADIIKNMLNKQYHNKQSVARLYNIHY